MSSENVFDGDWGEAQKAGKKAAQGVFFKLSEDEDSITVAFVQMPIVIDGKPFKAGDPPTTKMIANLALFTDDPGAEVFQKFILAEMAPKHWNLWMKRRKKFGGHKLFCIERNGVRDDKQVTYQADAIRDLTPEERQILSSTKMLEIKVGDTGSEADWLDQFRTDCATHCERIGWTQDQFTTSIKVFFGRMVKAVDMDGEQRMDYLSALKEMTKDSLPEAIKGEIDLAPDDSDFF